MGKKNLTQEELLKKITDKSGKMSAEKQYMELQQEKRHALTFVDIMVRYGCKETAARNIIRSIRAACGGGKLPRGKVLISELEYWENTPIKKQMRV